MYELIEKYWPIGALAIVILIASVAGTKFPASSPDNRSKGGKSKAAKGRSGAPIYVPGVSPRPDFVKPDNTKPA